MPGQCRHGASSTAVAGSAQLGKGRTVLAEAGQPHPRCPDRLLQQVHVPDLQPLPGQLLLLPPPGSQALAQLHLGGGPGCPRPRGQAGTAGPGLHGKENTARMWPPSCAGGASHHNTLLCPLPPPWLDREFSTWIKANSVCFWRAPDPPACVASCRAVLERAERGSSLRAPGSLCDGLAAGVPILCTCSVAPGLIRDGL